MNDLYRLVYTSHNNLEGTEEERAAIVAEILATSQRNNGRVGVTGALLFNAGLFAQVLEGTKKAVEATFERIQRDPRHGDVSVLQCEAVATRGFPNWSMAFVGHSERGRAMWSELGARTGFDLSRIEGDQLFTSLHAIVLDEEGPSADGVAEAAPDSSAPLPQPGAQPRASLDITRLRNELRDRGPAPEAAGLHAGAPVPETTGSSPAPDRPGRTGGPTAEVGHAVLRAALAEERERTTTLRRSLDEIRIALSMAQDETEALRRHRTVWAERARALAAVLCQEPDAADRGAAHEERDGARTALRAVG